MVISSMAAPALLYKYGCRFSASGISMIRSPIFFYDPQHDGPPHFSSRPQQVLPPLGAGKAGSVVTESIFFTLLLPHDSQVTSSPAPPDFVRTSVIFPQAVHWYS
jgi:hypothetical protein